MDSHFTIRAARYAAYVAAALLFLIVAFALVLPVFLDTPAVERELQAKLSQLVRGEVAWESLSIRLLPSPRGALSKVHVEIPGVAEVRAEQVNAHLRLLPLFHGRAEIAQVGLSKPVVRLQVARSASSGKEVREESKAGPVEGYRAVIDAIRGLAPDSEVEIEDGEVEVGLPDLPPVRVRALQLHGRTDSNGLALELAAASDAWRSLKISANVAFADYAGTAKAEIAGVKAQPWLERLLASSPVGVAVPEASVRLDARTDGKTRLESAFDVRAGSVEITRDAERVQIPDVVVLGKVSAGGGDLGVDVASAQLGASRLASGNVRYGLEGRSLAASAEFDLDLAQGLEATRRLVPEEAAKALERIQPVSGRAEGRAKFEMRRSAWSVAVDILKSDSAVGIEGLPAPVKVASGKVSVTRGAVKVERADVSLLDARAVASASIGYGKQLRIDGAASDGSVGEGALAWIWKIAGAPPKVVLKTPIRIGVQRASWGPGQALDVTATASFDAGPGIGVELGWTPRALDIRRATIKDAKSDAVLALHLEKGLAQGRFSGSLQSATIGGALRDAKVPSGGASGDLRFRVDLAHPGQGTATGRLKADTLDLAWLLGRPVTVERVDAEANGQKLLIREASVNWADQRFALSGTLERAADGAPIIDAKLDSPGVTLDALLPPKDAKEPSPAAKKDEGEGALWTRWPLPVRGHVGLSAGFIQYGERKAEPVVATLTLEAQKAFLELKEVQLCGISLPLTVAGTPEGLDVAVHLTARKQQLERAARCLTERGVLITGEFDLNADLRARGRPKDLVSNLEGTVSANSRDGRVMKFALLGNILSLSNVSGALKQGGPRLDEKGFPYRTLTARGRFERGTFAIDESGFSSDAVGLAATGHISLVDYKSQLTVLVAPFERVDRLVRGVPLVGYLVGGVLTSIPVGVSGDIRDPLVVPLGPGAVTSELKGVFERTITLPAKLVPQ